MAKANPTLLGHAKGAYIKGGGDAHTFVRCGSCKAKYVKETHPKGCPNGCPWTIVETKTVKSGTIAGTATPKKK